MNTKIHHKCKVQVRNEGMWPSYHPCKFKGIIERDGEWYCKKHDPVAIKEKYEQQDKLDEEEYKRKDEQWQRDIAMNHYCKNLTTEYMETHQAKTK